MEPVIEPAATRDWQPSGLERAILILLGAAIFVFFFGVFTNISSSGETVSISAKDLITALISLNALLVIHAWVHGLVMSRYGGTPRYGLKMIARIVPIAECTSPSHLFTRSQFALIVAAPMIVITIAGALLCGVLPGKSALPLALALHAACSIGDLWLVGMVLRQPPSSQFEVRPRGLRIHTVQISSNETGAA